MRKRGRRARRTATLVFVLLGLAWGGLLGRWQVTGTGSLLDRLEFVSLDLRFGIFGPRPPPRDVVIVAIDDEVVRRFGTAVLPRQTVAKLVHGIAAHAPRAIAVDILFASPGSPETDAELAEALRATKALIAAVALFEGESGPIPQPTDVIWPDQRFSESRSGIVNLSTDASGTPRFVPLLFRLRDRIGIGFPFAAAMAAAGASPVIEGQTITLGDLRIATDLGYHLPIRYYGPRATVRTVSAAQVLRGEASAADLRDRIVLVGNTAVAAGDTFATPFGGFVPGVEILATSVGNIVAGDGLARTLTTRWADAAAAVAMPVILVLLMSMGRIAVGFALSAVLLTAWVGATIVAFGAGYWLSAITPLAAAIPIAAAYGIARIWVDHRHIGELSVTTDKLRRFQAPALADRVSDDPDFLRKPVSLSLPVVFIDLSGFTGLSEALGPERTQAFLKEYHRLVDDAFTRHGGFAVDFMGDGAMGLFGFPDPSPRDPCRTVDAALALHAAVRDQLPALTGTDDHPVKARIGAHLGPVVVSRLGGDWHEQITATGDTVNVTSRLLEVAKQNGASMVFSQDLVEAAGQGCLDGAGLSFGPPIEVLVRGRALPIVVRMHPTPAPPQASARPEAARPGVPESAAPAERS